MFMDNELAELTATDVTGQKTITVKRCRRESTVGELLGSVVPRLHLPLQDERGHEILYQAHADRIGRHLHPTEALGEVFEDQDRFTVQPDIKAG